MSHKFKTDIQQHGDIASQPLKVYGAGDVILRIGNGGAGGTGLLEALANDYLSTKPEPKSIEWVCNHSRNAQLALFHGYVDIALTYEREQEEISVSEGWAENAGCMFHDHFCLVGPGEDPANVRGAKSIEEAFHKIATSQSLFYSRNDGSATMSREREIWRRVHRRPWAENAVSSWYITMKFNPADALAAATEAGAYLLNDRSTLLRQIGQGKVRNAAVFFEPTDPFHPLMNSCYALHTPRSSPAFNPEIMPFLEYLKSNRAQSIVATYGREESGFSLFAPLGDGVATVGLTGGSFRNGKWNSLGLTSRL